MKLSSIKKLISNVGKKLGEMNLYSSVKNVFKEEESVKEIINNSTNGATVKAEFNGKVSKDLVGIKRTTSMYRKTTMEQTHSLVLDFHKENEKVVCDVIVGAKWIEYTDNNKTEIKRNHTKLVLLEKIEVCGTDTTTTKKKPKTNKTVTKKENKVTDIATKVTNAYKKLRGKIENFMDSVDEGNELQAIRRLYGLINDIRATNLTVWEQNEYFFKNRRYTSNGLKSHYNDTIHFREEIEKTIKFAIEKSIDLHNEKRNVPRAYVEVIKFGLETYGCYDHNWQYVDLYSLRCEMQIIIDLYGNYGKYTYDEIIDEIGYYEFEEIVSSFINVKIDKDCLDNYIIFDITAQLDGQISLDDLVIEKKIEEQIEEIHMEQSIEKTVIEKEPTEEVNPLGIVQQKKEIYDYMFNELKLEKIVRKEIGFSSYLYTEGYEINGYKIKHNHLYTLGYFGDFKYVDEFYDSYVYNSMKLKELYYKLKDKFDIVPHTQTVGGTNNKKLVITHLEITKEKQIVNLENLSYIDVNKVYKSVDNYNFKIVYQVKNSLNTDLCYEIKMLEHDKPFTGCRWTPIKDMELGMSKERELIYDFYYRVSNSEIHFQDMQSAWDWYIGVEVEENEQPVKKVKNKKILDDIINLSSGTIATLINDSSYSEIDKIQKEFYKSIASADATFDSWQSAWDYYKNKKINDEEVEEMSKSRLHEIIDEKINKYAKKMNKEIKELSVQELDDFVENVILKDYVRSSAYKANGALTDILKEYGVDYRNKLDQEKTVINTEGIYKLDEIKKIISMIDNEQDKFIVYALYKGINGKKAEDLLSIKKGDIDFTNGTIKLKDRTIMMDDYLSHLASDAIKQKVYQKLGDFSGGSSTDSYAFNMECKYVIKGKPNTKNNNGLNQYGYEGLRRRLQILSDETDSRLSIDTLNRSGILHELNKIKKQWTVKELKTAVKENGWKGNIDILYNLLIEVYGMQKLQQGGITKVEKTIKDQLNAILDLSNDIGYEHRETVALKTEEGYKLLTTFEDKWNKKTVYLGATEYTLYSDEFYVSESDKIVLTSIVDDMLANEININDAIKSIKNKLK